MSSIKSRRAIGSRTSAGTSAIDANVLSRVRRGLLGSTALVAVGLAATGAMAQSYPVGGGTIVVTGGGTVTNNTGASGGFQANTSGSLAVTNVTLTNSTGSPSAHAVSLTATTFAGTGRGISLAGTNTLVAATGGNAVNLVSTGGENVGVGFAGVQNLTGLNGHVVQGSADIYHSGAGTLNLTAQTPGSGSGLLWTAGRNLGDTSLTGAFNATNFQYGANLTANNGFVYFTTGTGGAITGVNTGIRTSGTAGSYITIGSTINASAFGIQTGSGTAGNEITTNGAIVSGGTGIDATSGSATGNTITVNADITANGGPAIRTDGVFATSVAGGATVSGTTAGVEALTAGSSVTNSGTITAGGDAITFAAGGTITNNSGGQINGSNRGIYLAGGAVTVSNAGTINGVNNDGITAIGALTLTNTGTLSSGLVSGVAFVGGGSVTNSGTITGGNDATYGYGVQNASGVGTTTLITNQSGGLINGGTGSILLNGAGDTTIDLQSGSTTTGQILSNAGGTHTVTVAGALNGAYNAATGSGIDNITLTSTGSISGAVTLGAGNDTFTWQGGTFTSIDAGSGTGDVFNSVLGAGVSGSLNLSNLSNFESYNHQSGNLTLTGSRATGPGWTLVPGSSLTLDGSLTATSGSQYGITMNGNGSPATVSILTGATLNAFVGVWFNTGGGHNFSNAGTVTGSNTGLLTNGALTATNSGTITASTGGAFSTGFGVSTMTNSGILTGGSNAATGFGVLSQYAGITVTNTAGTISGGAGGILSGSGIYGGLLDINNAAGAQISGPVAITTGGTSSLTLNNSGRVLGGATGAIVANGSGAVSITNNAGGQIVSSGGAVISTVGSATITNAGLIGNGTVDGGGVYTAGGSGYAINVAGGTITNSGTITGGSAGVYSSNGLTLTNTGTITGDTNLQPGLYRDGVAVLGAPATILNAGTISAPVYSAVVIQGGSVTNAAGGTLSGGSESTYGVAVQFSTTGGSFTNYGTATGAGAGAVRVNDAGSAATITLHAGSTTGAILLNSGNDTVAIYNGRGTDSLATVDGASGITLQAAGTLAAASFGAINMGTGTNTLTLRGTGDGTAANGAAGTMATGSIAGLTNLTKLDSGTWTLTGAGSYAGTTTVSGGTLRVLNTGNGLGNGAVSIATGATLNFDNQTGGLLYIKGDTFTGAGRILFSGNAGSVTALGYGGNGNVVISLSQGGLIDVQSGFVLGSSSGQGLWTNNMGSLNIASGAHFDTVEGLVRVDALTGAGILSGGYAGTVPITLGVAGGSGTFSGVIRDSTEFAGRYLALTKVGAGTQTLSGTNTYTGLTSIEGGTLEVRNGSAIADTGVVSVSSGATFLVSNAETIGRLTGAGGVNLAGGSLTLANSSGTYSGAVSGIGSLVLSGGSLSLGGALTNNGGLTLSGTAGASLLSTGSITVAGNAVTMNGTANSFTNAGSVTSSGGTGVTSSGNMTLVNSTGGAISGQSGVHAGGVGTVINAVGASITGGSLNNAIRLVGNGSTLTNAGTISGTTNFAGVFFDGTGTVTNQAGGTISNTATAVQFSGAGSTLDNAGSISNTNTNAAVYFDNSGTVMNRAGGEITSSNSGGFAVQLTGPGSSITNAGTITAGSRAVHLHGANAVLGNSGTISGGNHGVVSLGTATVSNDLGGTISGTVYNGVYGAGSGTAVTNAGLITGGNAAVYLVGSNSSVTNTGTLRITGGSANTVVSGIFASGPGTTVTNSGLIDSSFDGGHGVSLTGGTGTITNQSGGVISGHNAAAIVLAGAGYSLDLQAGSTVNGLIDASGTTGLNTVALAGTLNGIYVGGSGSDVVTLVAGATFGTLYGEDGTDTLILDGLNDASLDIGQTIGFENRTMNGDGIWTLTGLDTDAADWTLNSGTLRLTGGQSINDGAGILINAGATLAVGASEAIGALNGGGSVTVDANQTLYVGRNDADSLFSGVISGAGGLTQFGAGTLTLSGANTYTGDTRVDAGTLRLGASDVIADASRLIVSSGATLDLQGFSETVELAYVNGNLDGVGTLTAAELFLNGATVNANLGAGNLFNVGGTSVLNGTAGAGLVSVLGGTLSLGASERLADTATLSIASGATFDLSGFDETVDVALINGTLNSTSNILMPRADDAQVIPALTVSTKGTDGPLTIPAPAGTGTLTAAEYYLNGATINANLGAGNLFNVGGTSVLNGTAGAGLVSVLGGTLSLGASERLGDAATLSVASGASLNLNAFNETVALAVLNGTLAGTGTLSAGEYQLNGATVNANLGAGNLFNVGGTSVLNGTAGAGLVSVLGGTLSLGASERLADTATLSIASGATFDLSGFDETVDVALINGTLNSTSNILMPRADNAEVIPALTVSTKGADGPLTIPAPTGTGTLTAAEYYLNGATINANLGAGNLFNVGGTSVLNGTAGAGLVSVLGGTLSLGASERLGDAATLSVASGASLNLNAFNETVALAVLNGTLAGTGTLSAGEYQLNGATVNANLGAGNLFNVGGTSVLNGTAGAGLVSVLGGTLSLGASERLADTATLSIASGATFDLSGFDETVDVALINGTLNSTSNILMPRADNAEVIPALTVSTKGADGPLTIPGWTGTLTAAEYYLNGATINANLGAGNLFNIGGTSVLNGTAGADLVSVLGGTLSLGASERLGDGATLSVASGASLNLNAFNETVALAVLNGTLAGTGTLSAGEYQLNGATVNANLGAGNLFNVGGTSVLNGTAGAGQVSVLGGRLSLGASERLANTATLSIASGAAFDLSGFNETIGALFGMGDLNLGSGRLTFGGEESAFGGRMTGTGSIVHTAGLFTLLGDHGLRTISNTGGELRFIGSTTGGVSLTGGSLTGAATIGGALTLAPGAVLSPGLADQNNGIGGFTLGGLTMNGGTLSLDVLGLSGGSLIDQIRVLGAANLTGGLVNPNFHGAATDFGFSSRYLFLSADQLIGRFANGMDFTADDSLEGLYWRVRYDLAPNGAVLELRQLTDFDPGTGGTGNQGAIGRALTGGQLQAGDDWAGVLDAFAGLEGGDLNAALDSVGGEALADMTTSMFSVSDNFLNAVRESAGLTTDGSQSLGYANRLEFGDLRDGRAAMVVGVMDAFDPATRSQGVSGGWVTAYASDATLEGKIGQADVDTRVNGFAFGYGAQRDNVTIGGAIGASRVEGDVSARSSSYESDVTHAAAYVQFDDGDWAAGMTASTYGGQLASQREIAIGAYRGFAIGSTDADGGAISASVSRRFHFDDDGSIALGAMATVSRSKVGSFTEDLAGGLSLEVEEQRRDWQTLQLGARGVQGYSVNGRSFRVYGGLGLLATTGDRDARADMRFSGAAAGFGGFTIEGAEMPPLAGVTDFGLEYEARDGLTLSAGYRGVVSDRVQDHQVGARLRAVW